MVRTLREHAKIYLADVPGEHVFRVSDGSVFRNLKELRDSLANMSEETYGYHANANKNDFSKWVKDVVGDEKLANELQASTSSEDAAKRVGTRVAALGRSHLK